MSEEMMSGPPHYLCPSCRQPAFMVIGLTQALCGTDDCSVVMFNPSLPDGGMSNVQIVDVPELP